MSGSNSGNKVGVEEYSSVLVGSELALSYESFSMQSVDFNALPVSVFGMGFDVVEPSSFLLLGAVLSGFAAFGKQVKQEEALTICSSVLY